MSVLEDHLTHLWRQVLRLPVGPDDDPFALGAHSLHTLELEQRAAQAGLPLTGETLVRHRRVRDQAAAVEALLARRHAQAWDSWVPLRRGGARPLLILAPGPTGDLHGYGSLVHHLGPDQPVAGFQAPGLRDPDATRPDLPGVAAVYVARLLELGPPDPLVLAGYCFGGLVAFEMAQQLRAQGRRVALVGLIECRPAAPTWREPGRQLHRLRCALRAGPRGLLRGLRGGPGPQEGRDDIVFRSPLRAAVYAASLRAAARYRPRPYPGRAVVLASTERPERFPDPTLRWGPLVERIETSWVPGGHLSLLREPHVPGLAQALRAAIDRLD